jgi:hypothetical protein
MFRPFRAYFVFYLLNILTISDELLSEMINLIDQKDKTIYHTTLEQKEAIKRGRE